MTAIADARVLLQAALEHIDQGAHVTARDDIAAALERLQGTRPRRRSSVAELEATRVVTVVVPAELVTTLQVLNAEGDAARTLLELAARVHDGVTRPGSWERGWLVQAFGTEWGVRIERDPDADWRQRVKR